MPVGGIYGTTKSGKKEDEIIMKYLRLVTKSCSLYSMIRICFGCTSKLDRKRKADEISPDELEILNQSEASKDAHREQKRASDNMYRKKKKKGKSLVFSRYHILLLQTNFHLYHQYFSEIDEIRLIPEGDRTPQEKRIWLSYLIYLLVRRRKCRRFQAFRSATGFITNYCGSTEALWNILPGESFQEKYCDYLLGTWNKNYPNEQFDTIEELFASNIEFHIDEIVSVWYLLLRDDDDFLHHIWNQVILWHKFNAQLLKGPENQSKGKEVDQATVDRITNEVKEHYLNPENQLYALYVAKCNIGTTEMLLDEDDGQEYTFSFPPEEWKKWYNSLNPQKYNYDEDISKYADILN